MMKTMYPLLYILIFGLLTTNAPILSTPAMGATADNTDVDRTLLSAIVKPKILLKQNAELPITTFNVTFKVGSADDPKGREGLATLTAALLRQGGVQVWNSLPARNRSQIEDFLFPYGAEIDLSVEKEQTSFQVTTVSSDANTIFQILSQMILAPAFQVAEFERIRAELLDAIEKRAPRESQEDLGKFALDRQVFGENHPYSHLTIGTIQGMKAIALDDVKNFYKTYFTQKRLTLGVAGVISPQLNKSINTTFVQLPIGNVDRISLPEPQRSKGIRMLIVRGPFEATGVHLGTPLNFNRSGKDFVQMYLGALAFGKHRSFVGRLMREVREIRGLNYGTFAYVEDFPHGSRRLSEPTQAARQQQAFTLWARPTPLNNGCFLLRQVYREVFLLSEKGLNEADFKLGKSHLVGSAPLLATSLDRHLGYEIDSEFYGIKEDYLKNLQRQAQKSSRNQVNALLKKHIDPRNIEIVVVTSKPEDFKREILSARCDIHYAPGVEKTADILAEDKMISEFSLTALGLKPENISIVDAESLVAH